MSEGNKYNYYKVKFLNTGYISEFRKDAILKGQIADRYTPTFLGKGIIGNIYTKGDNYKLYKVWADMLSRCYNPKIKYYKSYGAKGVYANDEWLYLENFMRDAKCLEGWDEDEFNKGNLQLDKDCKQLNVINKCYSKDTCIWLNKEINNKIQPSQQRRFIAISPDGKIYYDYNITDFARKHNLVRRGISAVLHKRSKTHLGWKFKFDE